MAYDEILFEQTGHLDISISDFGWWRCRACGKRGDDWSDPRDFICLWAQDPLFDLPMLE